jgi:NADPH-dependent curcumin reductase CurA
MSTRTNRQWRLVSRPEGRLSPSNFQWTETPVPPLEDGQALVRTVHLSLDPTNRGWTNASATYLPALELGDVMRGIGLGVVEESRTPALRPGQFVQGLTGWQSYLVTDGRGLAAFDPMPGMPVSAYLGLLGHIGATAYFGLLDIGKPQPGETVVVSAAAGAVGSLVGQIAKLVGCRVVGIAGGPDKCKWIVEGLGFDAAIDYKREPVLPRLRVLCRQGIDVGFENVGGAVLDAVLANLNTRGRIVLCGLIAQYNEAVPPPGPRYLGNLLMRRGRMEGFIVTDYAARFPEAVAKLAEWHLAGKLEYRVDIVDGLEQAPAALNRLFDGTNRGKLIVRVSAEP